MRVVDLEAAVHLNQLKVLKEPIYQGNNLAIFGWEKISEIVNKDSLDMIKLAKNNYKIPLNVMKKLSNKLNSSKIKKKLIRIFTQA